MGVRLDQAANVVPAAELRARRMVREAATGRRSRRRKPGRLRLPRGSELRYRRTLVGILSAVEKQVRAEVLPLVEKLTSQVAAGRPDARLDGPTEDFIESVERIREGLSSSILSPSALDAAASEIGSSVAAFNRRDLARGAGCRPAAGTGFRQPGERAAPTPQERPLRVEATPAVRPLPRARATSFELQCHNNNRGSGLR